MGLPQRITQQNHRRRAGFLFRCLKIPAKERANAQHGKKSRRHRIAADILRLRHAREIETDPANGGHLQKCAALVAPIEEVWIRHADGANHRCRLVQHDKTRGLFVRQWPQENSIDYGEDGGVRADAQRQG